MVHKSLHVTVLSARPDLYSTRRLTETAVTLAPSCTGCALWGLVGHGFHGAPGPALTRTASTLVVGPIPVHAPAGSICTNYLCIALGALTVINICITVPCHGGQLSPP